MIPSPWHQRPLTELCLVSRKEQCTSFLIHAAPKHTTHRPTLLGEGATVLDSLSLWPQSILPTNTFISLYYKMALFVQSILLCMLTAFHFQFGSHLRFLPHVLWLHSSLGWPGSLTYCTLASQWQVLIWVSYLLVHLTQVVHPSLGIICSCVLVDTACLNTICFQLYLAYSVHWTTVWCLVKCSSVHIEITWDVPVHVILHTAFCTCPCHYLRCSVHVHISILHLVEGLFLFQLCPLRSTRWLC